MPSRAAAARVRPALPARYAGRTAGIGGPAPAVADPTGIRPSRPRGTGAGRRQQGGLPGSGSPPWLDDGLSGCYSFSLSDDEEPSLPVEAVSPTGGESGTCSGFGSPRKTK
jgi:hypothetical protein